jgi:hypothetical protein
MQRSHCRPNQTRTRPSATTPRPIFSCQRTQVADAIGYCAGWDIAQRGTRGWDAFRGKTWQARIRAPTHMRLGSSAESTTHAVVPALVEACTAQHEMPTAGGARDCLLFIDAVCATAAAAVMTICEGVTMARDKPIVAATM